MSRPDSADFATIFLSGAPLIDTRAPVEFAQGAFPGAVNLPLMTDEERAQVGTRYKQAGQQAAIALGHQLVAGEIKAARVRAWSEFAEAHPDGYLYCFRGGLRSRIAQQWLAEAGVPYPRIIGGYKAMRRFLLDNLAAQAGERRFLVLSGQTGCAKTDLLAEIPGAIDLEGLANHRGSAFGKRVGGQPSQIGFENALSIALLRNRQTHGDAPLLLEDESRLIGRVAVPEDLRERTLAAPVVVLEVPLEERARHTHRNYILRNLQDWQAALGEAPGFDAFAEELQQSLTNLSRRLGGLRYAQLAAQMAAALAAHRQGDPEPHMRWIRELLADYYDPMYAYQLDQKAARVVFRGDRAAVRDYLRHAMA